MHTNECGNDEICLSRENCHRRRNRQPLVQRSPRARVSRDPIDAQRSRAGHPAQRALGAVGRTRATEREMPAGNERVRLLVVQTHDTFVPI